MKILGDHEKYYPGQCRRCKRSVDIRHDELCLRCLGEECAEQKRALPGAVKKIIKQLYAREIKARQRYRRNAKEIKKWNK